MDVHVLDVHRQVLQGTFCTRRPEADKITLEWFRLYSTSIQKLMLLHQPVNFFMVDNPAPFFEFTGHVPVAITAELLMQGGFNIIHHQCIFQELALPIYAVGARPDAFRATSGFVIIAAGLKCRPAKKLFNRNTS